MASVDLAWALNADAVEIDVHLTRDRQIVVIHDADLQRLAQSSARIAELTLAELQEFDVGSWKAARYAGERVPTLSEVINTIPQGKRRYVELKCSVDVLDPLEEVLKQVSDRPESVILIGFDPELIPLAKQRFPQHLVYQVVEQTLLDSGEWSPGAQQIINHCRRYGLDGADLSNTLGVNAASVDAMHAAGLRVCIWTVNTLVDARRLIAAGVDGLTSDDCGLMLTSQIA